MTIAEKVKAILTENQEKRSQAEELKKQAERLLTDLDDGWSSLQHQVRQEAEDRTLTPEEYCLLKISDPAKYDQFVEKVKGLDEFCRKHIGEVVYLKHTWRTAMHDPMYSSGWDTASSETLLRLKGPGVEFSIHGIAIYTSGKILQRKPALSGAPEQAFSPAVQTLVRIELKADDTLEYKAGNGLDKVYTSKETDPNSEL